eukprot:6883207-Prymnesium_polylepis.1
MQPYSTFADAVFLSGEFNRRANETLGYDQFDSDDLQVQAARIEHIACGLLRVLGKTSDDLLTTFLESESAAATIRDAVHNDCKVCDGSACPCSILHHVIAPSVTGAGDSARSSATRA